MPFHVTLASSPSTLVETSRVSPGFRVMPDRLRLLTSSSAVEPWAVTTGVPGVGADTKGMQIPAISNSLKWRPGLLFSIAGPYLLFYYDEPGRAAAATDRANLRQTKFRDRSARLRLLHLPLVGVGRLFRQHSRIGSNQNQPSTFSVQVDSAWIGWRYLSEN